MKITVENKKKLTLWIIGIVAVCILLFAIFQNFNSIIDALSKLVNIFSPLILGFIFALILNVPMRFFESILWPKNSKKFLKKIRRPIAFIISLIIILGILTGVICLVIPELYASIKVIISGAISIVDKLKASEEIDIFGVSINQLIDMSNWDEIISKAQEILKMQSGNIVNTALYTITSLIGGIVDFLISFVFALYILFSKDTLKMQTKRLIQAWIPSSASKWFMHACSIGGKNFRNFISGQTIEALILGSLCAIGMLILRIPYVPMVSVLVGITALVPVVGGFIGAGVGAFMILTVDPIKAIIFIVFLIILQQLENNLIYPKVMGSRVNLPSIWILAAVTVGGGIGGVLGMFLSVPLVSTAYILIKELTLNREKSKKEITVSEDFTFEDASDFDSDSDSPQSEDTANSDSDE